MSPNGATHVAGPYIKPGDDGGIVIASEAKQSISPRVQQAKNGLLRRKGSSQ
jgi:hypothetical protein